MWMGNTIDLLKNHYNSIRASNLQTVMGFSQVAFDKAVLWGQIGYKK